MHATNHENAFRSPASSTETFTDANNPSGLVYLAIGSGTPRTGPPSPDGWAAELSGSFAIIASQLQNASRAIAAAPSMDHHHQVLTARLDAIEQAQERLAVELAGLRSLHAGKSRENELPASSGSLAHDLERRLSDALATQKLE